MAKMAQSMAILPRILLLATLLQLVCCAPFIVETNSLHVKSTGQVFDTAMAAVSLLRFGISGLLSLFNWCSASPSPQLSDKADMKMSALVAL